MQDADVRSLFGSEVDDDARRRDAAAAVATAAGSSSSRLRPGGASNRFDIDLSRSSSSSDSLDVLGSLHARRGQGPAVL